MDNITFNFNKDEIAQAIIIGLKGSFKDEIKKILKEILQEMRDDKLPRYIKGDKNAGKILGVSTSTMRNLRLNGAFRNGIDYFKKSDKIILYDTNALILKRDKNEKF